MKAGPRVLLMFGILVFLGSSLVLGGRIWFGLGLLLGTLFGGLVWLALSREPLTRRESSARHADASPRVPDPPILSSTDPASRQHPRLLKLRRQGPFVEAPDAPMAGGVSRHGMEWVYLELLVVGPPSPVIAITAIHACEPFPVLWTLARRKSGPGMQHPFGGAMPDQTRLILNEPVSAGLRAYSDAGLRTFCIPIGIAAPEGTNRIVAIAEGTIGDQAFQREFEVNFGNAEAWGNW